MDPASLVAAHPELKDSTLLILNLEHVAYADVVRGKTRAPNNTGMSWEMSVTEAAKAVGVTNESPFLIDLWRQAARCYGVATYQSVGPTVSGDLGGYRPLGVPMTQMIQSGTFYHSSGDVYEAVPAEGARTRRPLPRVPAREGRRGAGGADHRRQGHAVSVDGDRAAHEAQPSDSDFRLSAFLLALARSRHSGRGAGARPTATAR